MMIKVNDIVKIISVPAIKDQMHVGCHGSIKAIVTNQDNLDYGVVELSDSLNFEILSLPLRHFKVIPALPTKREVLLNVLRSHSLDEAHNTWDSQMRCTNIISALLQSDDISIEFKHEVQP
jgi:hypothetical protein